MQSAEDAVSCLPACLRPLSLPGQARLPPGSTAQALPSLATASWKAAPPQAACLREGRCRHTMAVRLTPAGHHPPAHCHLHTHTFLPSFICCHYWHGMVTLMPFLPLPSLSASHRLGHRHRLDETHHCHQIATHCLSLTS